MTDTKYSPPSRFQVLLAGIAGNVMEWYDFAVYGFFATVFAELFFPSEDPTVSLIAAFGAFAAGFLVRPLGGLIFGHIGDKIGRKKALTLSVLAMAVPTVLIGCLPTYETIGVLAPALIVLLRILQGLSVGGEYTSSVVFLVEHSEPKRRGLWGQWGMWGAACGIMLGSLVGTLLTSILTDDQVAAWGWRLPFWCGALVAISGYLFRRSLHAEPTPSHAKSPVVETFRTHWRQVLLVAALNVANGVAFYTAFVYTVTYIKQVDNMPARFAFEMNTEAMIGLLLLLPFAAILSDRIGRRKVMIAGTALLTLTAIPLFDMIHAADDLTTTLGEFGLVVSVALIGGALSAANVELIPAEVRCTGLAFAYNAAIGVFGGLTPMVAAWLIANTADPIAPAYWVTIAALVSCITAIFFMRETAFDPLEARPVKA